MTAYKNSSKQYTVKEDQENLRLDVFLSKLVGSRASAAKMICVGLVRVDGKQIKKPSFEIACNNKVTVMKSPAQKTIKPLQTPLNIIYEDADVIVINKPAGLLVHPCPGQDSCTLINALSAKFQNLPIGSGINRPGIVHRLDRDTSGILIVAKNEDALRFLQKEFKERRVAKVYLALVFGSDLPNDGIIDSPIARERNNRTKMLIRSGTGSRNARTHFHVLQKFAVNDSANARVFHASLLEIRIETGRTHQIRVHLNAIHHPILGDDKYGNLEQNKFWRENYGLSRQFLHAHLLSLCLPCGVTKEFIAPLADDLQSVINSLLI
ncbi:MAG: RluA family pseudouridine synthase [Patescibacteria group bacterium]|nr:RluA family pseudouridine synthase [Patescibacteria group bacterium]